MTERISNKMVLRACALTLLVVMCYGGSPTATITISQTEIEPPTLTKTQTWVSMTDSTTQDCDEFEVSKLTYFEKECFDHIINATQKYCIRQHYGAEHHTAEGVGTIHLAEEDHAQAPHNVLVLFGTFALGAFVRFWCLGTDVPFTVVMFVLGLAFGLVGKSFGKDSAWDDFLHLADMNPHLILYVFLPVLIFESAFAMEIPIFKKVVVQCILLAGPGLLVASAMTGLMAKVVFTEYDWPLEACLLFGTILSATDPVAVVALLKELGASQEISTMIEGESLFNDGTAIVFFNVLISALEKDSCTPVWDSCGDQCVCPEFNCELPQALHEIFFEFLYVALVGPIVGLVIGGAVMLCLERVYNDTLIEVTLTLTSAYITFFVCEGFLKVSGVLGLVALGCVLSYFRYCISPEVEHILHHFWEMAVFLTNSCIFALAGMIVALKAITSVDGVDVIYLIITYATINIVRFFVLGLFTPILRCFKYKLNVGNSVLVGWGGLRGAVGLSLALVLRNDENILSTPTFDNVRNKVIFHTAGIVLLTLCVNGITTQFVVSKFKLDAVPDRRKRMMRARFLELEALCRDEIEELGKEPLNYDCNWAQVREITDLSLNLKENYVDPYNHKNDIQHLAVECEKEELDEGRIAYLNAAKSSIRHQYASGEISAHSARVLGRMVQWAQEIKEYESVSETMLSAEDLVPNFSPPKWNIFQKRAWLTSGFEVAIGYIEIHRHCQKQIPLLAKREVSNIIITHCKKTTTDAVQMLSDRIRENPGLAGFARSVRTKHVARDCLNTMRASLARMSAEGRLDGADRMELNSMIESQMAKIAKSFPRTVNQVDPEEALGLAAWYPGIEIECKEKLLRLAQKPTSIRTWPADIQTSFLKQMSNELGRGNPQARGWVCPGLFVIITGVVQLRLGRKMFHFGSGYTCGLQSITTGPHPGSERFSDIFCETPCTILFLDRNDILPLMNDYPSFSSEIWRYCGASAARLLLGVEQHQVWSDQKVRRVSAGGYCDFLLDPSNGDSWKASRRQKTPENHLSVLLRGRVWEFTPDEELRFPMLLPPGFKYGTFTNHAVVYYIPSSVWANQSTKALQHWGRLKSKIRSIALWSGLRGPDHARCALSLAFGRSPPLDCRSTPAAAEGKQSNFILPPLPEKSIPSTVQKDVPDTPNTNQKSVSPVTAPIASPVTGETLNPVTAQVANNENTRPSQPPSVAESDWKETWNEKFNRPYYWNTKTGQRVWKEPAELTEHKRQTQLGGVKENKAAANQNKDKHPLKLEPIRSDPDRSPGTSQSSKEPTAVTQGQIREIVQREVQTAINESPLVASNAPAFQASPDDLYLNGQYDYGEPGSYYDQPPYSSQYDELPYYAVPTDTNIDVPQSHPLTQYQYDPNVDPHPEQQGWQASY
eukprot:TRINITY_DN9489_c1_g1_i1.p1 TRINITY_DN9489_c1_g1~~TRINITY_DN9489_c1_g1_i1.p1  ORF type:complete len:1399 (+),score=234.10 TRINITY_DN9489_c1_g1_i1:38-4234(+)